MLGTIAEVFRDNFRRLKKERGMTFERLSEVSGISIPALNNYAAGRIPETPMIARLAAALGVSEVELFQTHVPAPRPTPAQALEVLRDALIQKNVEILQQRGFAAPTPDLGTALDSLPVPKDLRDLLRHTAEAWLSEHREPASKPSPASGKSRKPSG